VTCDCHHRPVRDAIGSLLCLLLAAALVYGLVAWPVLVIGGVWGWVGETLWAGVLLLAAAAAMARRRP
jgi:hypothetical protein